MEATMRERAKITHMISYRVLDRTLNNSDCLGVIGGNYRYFKSYFCEIKSLVS